MAPRLLPTASMSQPPIDDDEVVRRKVIYEHNVSSGSSRQAGVTIAVILAIAVALLAWILMHLH